MQTDKEKVFPINKMKAVLKKQWVKITCRLAEEQPTGEGL